MNGWLIAACGCEVLSRRERNPKKSNNNGERLNKGNTTFLCKHTALSRTSCLPVLDISRAVTLCVAGSCVCFQSKPWLTHTASAVFPESPLMALAFTEQPEL